MSITAKNLKALIAQLPDDATLFAYEGEDIGLAVVLPDGRSLWIRARDDGPEEPPYTEGFQPLVEIN